MPDSGNKKDRLVSMADVMAAVIKSTYISDAITRLRALPSVAPAPVSGDVISREAAIEATLTWHRGLQEFVLRDRLRALPSVAPEVTREQIHEAVLKVFGDKDWAHHRHFTEARAVLAALGLTVKE